MYQAKICALSQIEKRRSGVWPKNKAGCNAQSYSMPADNITQALRSAIGSAVHAVAKGRSSQPYG
jgi:hypothetical protein